NPFVKVVYPHRRWRVAAVFVDAWRPNRELFYVRYMYDGFSKPAFCAILALRRIRNLPRSNARFGFEPRPAHQDDPLCFLGDEGVCADGGEAVTLKDQYLLKIGVNSVG